MRRVLFLVLLVATLLGLDANAASRIIKVLPQYLDLKGRHALSPSLYERDAYQLYLREHPKERSAIRFNVQWKSDEPKAKDLKLKIEARGNKGKTVGTTVLETTAIKNGWITNWTPVEMTGEKFDAFGDLIAWRATLWDGDKQIAEQKSFLW